MPATAEQYAPNRFDAATVGWLSYLRQPDAFCREQLRSFNDPWQRAALAHLCDPDVKALFIVSGHGTGKTRLAAHAVFHAGLCWGGRTRIPCTAPKQQLLADKLWPEIAKVRDSSYKIIRRNVEWSKTKLQFFKTPGWEAIAETAKDVEGLAGHHEERVLFVVEEATGVDEQFWPVILGALSTSGSKLLAISNYTRTAGYFASRFDANHPGEKLMRLSWNPRGVPGVREHDPSQPYLWTSPGGAQVETWFSDRPDADNFALPIVREYGWDGDITRVRLRGLPPKESSDALVTREAVMAAYGREVEGTAIDPVVWAWDVAGVGRDRSVIAQRRGNTVERIRLTQHTNVSLAAREMAAEMEVAKPDQVNIDVVGIGTGPADELAADGYYVTRVNVGSTDMPDADRKKFVRQRAKFYWLLREDFMKGRIALSPSIPREIINDLAEELEATSWKIAPDGRIDIVSKDAIKSAIGRSPDIADALMLHYADMPSPVGAIEIGGFGGALETL